MLSLMPFRYLRRRQFIADIRGARVRELEEKRINKEMANIRKKFKGTPNLCDNYKFFAYFV